MPRRHRTESLTSRRRLKAVERQKKALELRILGMNFDEIAEELGYASRSGAYHAVMAGLNRVPAPEATDYRKLNLERLNRVRKGYMPKALKGEEKSVRLELSTQEREAKYLDLDAPTRIGNAPGEDFRVSFGDMLRKAAQDADS